VARWCSYQKGIRQNKWTTASRDICVHYNVQRAKKKIGSKSIAARATNKKLGRTHIIKGNLMINSGCPSLESIIKLGSKIGDPGPKAPGAILSEYRQYWNIWTDRYSSWHAHADWRLIIIIFLGSFLHFFLDLLSAWTLFGGAHLFIYSAAFVFLVVRRF